MPRVLFCGTNDRMIENVMNLVTDNYEKRRSVPTQVDFTRGLTEFKPHVIIVCLQNETKGALGIYNMLCNDPAHMEIPVIVIGYEDDCSQFKMTLKIKNIESFFLPLNRNDFLKSLEKFAKMSVKAAQAAEKAEAEKAAQAAKRASSNPIAIPPMPESMPEISPEDTMDIDDLLGELGLVDKKASKEKTLVKKMEGLSALNGRKSILVVDDDVRMLNVIKLYLEELYDVTVVPSGKLALKYINKKHADLILLDYMMPEMDGPEVLREIRKNSPCPNVPVIFLTGVADRDLVIKGLEFLPSGYLLKPVTREILLEKVTEIVLGLK